MVTASRVAGVPIVILSPTVKAAAPPPKPPRICTLMFVAPALASAARDPRTDCVPTFVTVTVSMPWPTLAMSNTILSPAEMLATFVTLMLRSPGWRVGAQPGLRARLADRGDRHHLVLLDGLCDRGIARAVTERDLLARRRSPQRS